MARTRVYKRRHPERTDYYRIIDSRFEELERMWPECFEPKYGYITILMSMPLSRRAS